MRIEVGSTWVDDDYGLDIVVKSIIAAAFEKTKVVYDVFDNTGDYLGYNSCTYEVFLDSKTPKTCSYEDVFKSGYNKAEEYYKSMQEWLNKEQFEEGFKEGREANKDDQNLNYRMGFNDGWHDCEASFELGNEFTDSIQEQAFDEGYDQAIDDLIEAGVIGEDGEDYLDEGYSEYEFGAVEDDEEEYCFSKELERVLNGEFTSSINFDGNKKDTSILDEYNRGYEDGKSRGITIGYNKRDYATSKPLEGCDGTERKHSHYFKDVRHLDFIDVYQVCKLFPVDDDSGAITHARKKLLVAGGRGAGKDMIKDITEARDTLNRYLQIEGVEE